MNHIYHFGRNTEYTIPCIAISSKRTKFQLVLGEDTTSTINKRNVIFTGVITIGCERCVLQWWYNAGSNWDCDSDGCGVGHGKQEHFVNYADVKITE